MDILTVLIRLSTILLPLIVAIAIPILLSRLHFFKQIKNKWLKIIVIICFIIGGILVGLLLVPFIIWALAMIVTFEQSSGMCFGISCPIGC